MPYKTPVNENVVKVPSYLRAKKATENLSPASFDTMDAFKSTLPDAKFYICKGVPRIPDTISKFKRSNPGPANYDIRKLEKGFAKITMGAARGWK